MENRRRSIKGINGEIQVPEVIIQHIQSFLTGKEAAQTSILSKSWYAAWSTHPDVDFDQRYFAGSQAIDGFAEFTRATLQRYEDLNRKIKSLKLWMYAKSEEGYYPSLANELIVKAIELGASDLHLEFPRREPPFIYTFVIPPEVLGSAALTSLSLIGCTVERGVNGKVNCSRLKSLCLDNVFLGDIIWDVIANCPLIEKLTFIACVYKFEDQSKIRVLALSPPFIFGRQIVGSTFHNLNCLFLKLVCFDSSFFSDCSSKFPCLKDLTVHECYGYGNLHIFSKSLECISFVEKKRHKLRARFDVPIIRKFSFSGRAVPALSFQTTSREWESDISFLHGETGDLSVPKLKKLLKRLHQSKISLSLNIMLLSDNNFEYVGDSPRPVVENLFLMMMDTPSSVCSALLGCLFWSCRPKLITTYIEGKGSHNTVKILCKRLIQFDQDCYVANRHMYGQCDLEEVNVECFEEDLALWRPLPPNSLLGASEGYKSKQIIRFLLSWGQ